jgi:hypothetical protein
MIRSVLVALTLLLSPTTAWAQATTAPVDASRPTEAFTAWMERTMALMSEASNALTPIGESTALLVPGRDRATIVSQARSLRNVSTKTRSALANVRTALETHGPYTGAAPSEDLRQAADAIYSDTRKYITDIDAVLAAVVDLTNAIERNDATAIRRLVPQVKDSARVLLDGQIITVRGRQRLISIEETDYHSLGALGSFYSGMRTIALSEDGSAGESIRVAAAATAEWVRSGRAVLAKKRAGVVEYRAADRALLLQVYDLDEKAFVVIDQMVATLNAAAEELQTAGAGRSIARKYIPEFARLETAYQDIVTEQFNLASRALRE